MPQQRSAHIYLSHTTVAFRIVLCHSRFHHPPNTQSTHHPLTWYSCRTFCTHAAPSSPSTSEWHANCSSHTAAMCWRSLQGEEIDRPNVRHYSTLTPFTVSHNYSNHLMLPCHHTAPTIWMTSYSTPSTVTLGQFTRSGPRVVSAPQFLSTVPPSPFPRSPTDSVMSLGVYCTAGKTSLRREWRRTISSETNLGTSVSQTDWISIWMEGNDVDEHLTEKRKTPGRFTFPTLHVNSMVQDTSIWPSHRFYNLFIQINNCEQKRFHRV